MEPDASASHLTCPVCFELTPDTLDECGHTLCHACAGRWFRKDTRCPMCRTPIHWKHPPDDEAAPQVEAPREPMAALDVEYIQSVQRSARLEESVTAWPFPWTAPSDVALRVPGDSLLERVRSTMHVPIDLELANDSFGVRVINLPARTDVVGRFRGVDRRLHVGDVITHVNGVEVQNARHASIAMQNGILRQSRVVCTVTTRKPSLRYSTGSR